MDAHGRQALPLQGVGQAVVCCQGLDFGTWPQLTHKSGGVPYVGRLQHEDAAAQSGACQDAAGRLQAQHYASWPTREKECLAPSCTVLHPKLTIHPLHPPKLSLGEGEPGLLVSGTVNPLSNR